MKSTSAKWDVRFLKLAEHVAQWSKDPSTRTGAVIVDGNRVVSLGYNGLAQGVADTSERLNNRELKYKLIIHCERNALLFANRNLHGCTLYTFPFAPCLTCASMVIQSGIKRVVAPETPKALAERWGEELDMSVKMFQEAGVKVNLYNIADITKFVGAT